MARKSGDGRGRLGGRQKGTPNKNTQNLIERAEALGTDPFEILCHIASNNWRALGYRSNPIELKDRQSAADSLCQYMYPKRKAVDLKVGEDSKPITVTFVEAKKK